MQACAESAHKRQTSYFFSQWVRVLQKKQPSNLKATKQEQEPPDPQNQCCWLKQVSRTLHKKQPLWFPSFTATFFNIDVGGAGASDTC